MAAVTPAVATASSSDTTSYASGAFTPAANDLLVVFVVASDTVSAGTLTDSQSLGFTKITSCLKRTSLDTAYCYVANALAANSSMTVTFACADDGATGCIIEVARVSSMTRTGSSAVRQFKTLSNGTGAVIASPVFDAACLTGNPTLEAGATGETTMTPPASWTEGADTSYVTPGVVGLEYHYRNSGFTGTDMAWSDSLATGWGSIVVELDTSAAGGSTIALAADVAGVGALAAALSDTQTLAATVAGTGAVAVAVVKQLVLDALVAGTGTVTDALALTKAVAALVAGTATVVVDEVAANRVFAAVLAGQATVVASLDSPAGTVTVVTGTDFAPIFVATHT